MTQSLPNSFSRYKRQTWPNLCELNVKYLLIVVAQCQPSSGYRLHVGCPALGGSVTGQKGIQLSAYYKNLVGLIHTYV